MKNSNDAMAFAIAAIGTDRVDKGGSPYVRHLMATAAAVDAATGYRDDEAVQAAILHDLCEDHPVTLDDLTKAGFSGRVVFLVDALTKRPSEEPIDYWMRVIDAGPTACAIKAADAAHNSKVERLGRVPTLKEIRSMEFYSDLSWIMANADNYARVELRKMLLDNEARGRG